MSGICGWAGKGSAADPRPALERMLAPFEAPPPQQELVQGIGCGAGTAVAMDSNAGVLVALAGRPRHDDGANGAFAARDIAERYRARGLETLDELKGHFALAVIDLTHGDALLAVDRFGVEPLYFSVRGEALLFSSRADSLAAHPLGDTGLDAQSIFDYVYFHCIPAPRSVYAHQQRLLPGQFARFRGGRIQIGFYWQLSYDSHSGSSDTLENEFRHSLEQAVARAADSGPVGAFLSGGTDSSTITGLLSRLQERVDTYSIGFDAGGYDEMQYARIASRHFGTVPHEYYVTPEDVVAAVPLIARAYDEPFGNASAVPTYYCARTAVSDGTSVLLAGDGGDEVFGGNERYAKQLVFEQYGKLPRRLRTGMVEPLLYALPALGPLRKAQSYVEQANVLLPDRLESYNFVHRASAAAIFTPEFLRCVDTDEPLETLRDAYSRTQSDNPLHRMMHLDLKITLADNDLRKVSRMCALAGAAVRYPMLDDDLVHFAARIPPDLLVRHFKLRYFFKKALADFLPGEILTKSKHGFGLPFGVWLRDYAPLQALAQESLQALKARGYIRADYIDRLQQLHRTEHAAYYGVMIWVLMLLEQWLQAHDL